MRPLRRTGLAAAVLTAAAVLAACSTGTDASTQPTPAAAAPGNAITIGIDLPLSGPSAAPAESMRKGFELTAKEINDAGGVNGTPIALDIQDDAGDPTTGVALVDRFVQNGAVAIAGTYNSPVVLAQSDAVARAQIPQLAFAISSAITKKNNPWVFQTGPTDLGQIDGIVARLKSQGLAKPALLTDTTAFGAGAKPVLEQGLAAAGLTPVLSDTFAVDATDLSAVLLKAKQSGADHVIAWTVGPPYATLAKGAEQVGLGLPIVGTASAADPAVARLAGPAATNIFFQDAVNREKPQVKAIVEKWSGEFGGTVPSDALSAHDILTVIVDGIRAVGPDRAKLRDHLETYRNPNLLSGRIGSVWEYSPTNHVGLVGGNLVWKQYDNGTVRLADGS